MLKVRLEPDPLIKLQQLRTYSEKFSNTARERLVDIAINKAEENINERIAALHALRSKLTKIPNYSLYKSLTDKEVSQLYHLIIDEAEFAIVIYPEQFTVQEITNEKGHEDRAHKLKVTRDIEENDALLRAEAALLITDFGQTTKKFKELKHKLISAITAILGNMLGEPHGLFLKEVQIDDGIKPVPSLYFKEFVEALYFIDKKATDQIMKIFNITVNDFSLERRKK